MALTNLGAGLLWPSPISRNGLLAVTNQEVWSVTPRLAWIFQCPKAGTLDGLEFLLGTVFSSQTMRVSFQDLSGSDPDGVQDQFADFTASPAGWKTTLITSDGTSGGVKRTVTQGQWVAAVIQYPGTAGDVYCTNITDSTSGGMATAQGDGYVRTHNGTSWNTTPSGVLGLNIALKYNDGSYGQFLGLHVPMSSVTTESFASNSTPDEIGFTFDVVAPLRVTGAWLYIDEDAAFDVVLYATNGTTALGTVSTTAIRGTSSMALGYVRFPTPLDLTVGTSYRLALKPTTTSTVGLQVVTVANSALRAAWPGGSSVQYTARTDAGSWTQTATKLPQMGLIVTGLEVGGGSGGGGTSVPFFGFSG